MSKQQKQQFLKTEIILGGYDCQQFIQYLTENIQHGSGEVDLEQQIAKLSLLQLRQYVGRFKRSKQQNYSKDFQNGQYQPIVDENNKTKNDEKVSIELQSQTKKKMDSGKKNQALKQKNLTEGQTYKLLQQALKSDNSNKVKFPCLKLQQNILQHHLNIRFTITDMVIQEQNKSSYMNMLFKYSEIIYTLKTQGRNKNNSIGISWVVKRKFSDFEWLRNTLVKFYPGVIIPPLPKSPLTQQQDSKISVKNKIQYFLRDLYKQKELRNSKYFQIFLSYMNMSDFENERKKSQQLPKPSTLNLILNTVGEVQCNFHPGLNSYTNIVGQYVTKCSGSLQKVKQICKQIGFIYDSLTIKFEQFSEICTQLNQHSQEISNQKIKGIKCFQKLSNTYKYLTDLIRNHSILAQKQKQQFNKYFTDYFTYQQVKIENILPLLEKRNQFATFYEKASYNPNAKGLFTKFSTKVFGEKIQYIDKPSPNYETLKNQFGYFNNQLLKETLKFIENEVSSYIDHFTEYGNNRINSIDQMQQYWSRIMVNVSKLNIDAFF